MGEHVMKAVISTLCCEFCRRVCVCTHACVCVHVRVCVCARTCSATQSCPTLCDPVDHSPLGSSVCGIFSGKNPGEGCHFLLQKSMCKAYNISFTVQLLGENQKKERNLYVGQGQFLHSVSSSIHISNTLQNSSGEILMFDS